MELNDLKQLYSVIQKEHKLPEFDELNGIFDIGKIEHDSGNLLRDIRRAMIEKVAHYLRLMELMINPSQASPIFLILLREVNSADKQILDTVFAQFIELELTSYRMDVHSTHGEEGDFVKRIYDTWVSQKDSLSKLIGVLERNWKAAAQSKKRSRDYFS